MNLSLKKEIIHHIFNRFNLLTKEDVHKLHSDIGPTSKKFLLDQKLIFEIDDKKYTNNIWSGEAEVEGSRVQFAIADLTEDLPEYILILQLDIYPPNVIRISLDPEDAGAIFSKIEDQWVEAPVMFQAKILIAVEQLMEMFISWNKNVNSEEIYKSLIDFLKFEGENEA